MTQTYCARCGREENREEGIIIAYMGEPERPICTLCRADELREMHGLTRSESRVAARKEAGRAKRDEMRDRTDESRGAVGRLRRRLRQKIRSLKRLF